MWELFRFSRRSGSLRRGLRIRTRPVDKELAGRLREAVKDDAAMAWGWYHREGDSLFVFVNPQYTGDGERRLDFIHYIVEVDLGSAAPQIAYRVPVGITLLFSWAIVAMFPIIWLLHRAYTVRIDKRLSELASMSPDSGA